jgi:hypothetical protein
MTTPKSILVAAMRDAAELLGSQVSSLECARKTLATHTDPLDLRVNALKESANDVLKGIGRTVEMVAEDIERHAEEVEQANGGETP